MHFDLFDLRLFVFVAEESNLRRGAERAYISLAAASTRIKQLEDSIGTRLFFRKPQGVELNPAGEALLHHARRSSGRWQAAWIGVAAVAGGSGIWATHFIAMLAFEPGLPTGYETGLTVLSLVYAIAITGGGLALSLQAGVPFAPVLGGMVLGGGIAAMHYTGMAAFEVPGHILWDRGLVAASLIIGAVLGGAGLTVALARKAGDALHQGHAARQIAAFGHEGGERLGRADCDEVGDFEVTRRRDGIEAKRHAGRRVPDELRGDRKAGEAADRQHGEGGRHDIAEARHGSTLRRRRIARCCSRV